MFIICKETIIIYCESYYEVGDVFEIECNNQIQNIEFDNNCLKLLETNSTVAKIEARETGLVEVTVTDVHGSKITKNIMIK